MRDVVYDTLSLRGVYECTLDAEHLLPIVDEHVPTPDKIFSTLGVKDGTGVYLRGDFKGNTCWKVCLDKSRDNVGARTLGR